MSEYLLLLRGGKPMAGKTEEEQKAEIQAWGAYMGGLTQDGKLVGGLPLQSGGKTVSASETLQEPVNAEPQGIIGGYLIVKAENIDEATAIAQACPHVANQGNVEVREIAPMPAM